MFWLVLVFAGRVRALLRSDLCDGPGSGRSPPPCLRFYVCRARVVSLNTLCVVTTPPRGFMWSGSVVTVL
jgi:hypothetical protein